MIAMQLTNSPQTAHWTVLNQWCEIVADCAKDGRIWEFVVELHGLKGFMKSDTMFAMFGSFAVVGRKVEYRCHIGSDHDIKTWGISQNASPGEMWDDIRFLIDGHAEPLV